MTYIPRPTPGKSPNGSNTGRGGQTLNGSPVSRNIRIKRCNNTSRTKK